MTTNTTDTDQDFQIVEVIPCMSGTGRDSPDYYKVYARIYGVASDRGQLSGLTEWLGFPTIDGHLTCTGWDYADQWTDAHAERVLGTKSAVELGERILAAAVVP